MKKLSHIYALVVAVIFAACADNTFVDKRPVVDADHMLITFRTEIPDMQVVTTRNADPDGLGIQSLSLLCFDEAGDFISRVTLNPSVDADMLGGRFEAVVPQYTKIIHFVANQNFESFNEPGSVGKHENTIIPGLVSSSSMLVYWGRVECPAGQELDAYIQAEFNDPDNGKAVPLYRNQGKITVESGDSGYEVTGFAVGNEYAFGTVAPFNTETNTFDWSNSSQYVSLPADLTKATDPTEVSETDAEYVFENENASGDEVYVIFRAHATGETDEFYYRVSLLDNETQEPLPILRNHHYQIRIMGQLDNGVATFAEAVEAPPVNNIWISIDENIPTVSDGSHVLGVDETFVVYDVAANAQGFRTSLGYTYTTTDGAAVGEDEKPVVSWLENNVAAPGITNTYNTNNDGKGEIGIELLAMGGQTRREGTLLVKQGKLQRTVKIILMQTLDFTPAWVSTQVSSAASGEGVTLMFNIPEETPEELFPMTVRIGANQLNPDISLNKLDVINRTSASKEEWGETITIDGEEIGFKYIYTATAPGVQRIYFKTDLAGSEQSQISIEADHFTTVTKYYTFSDESATITVKNTYKYDNNGSTVQYLLVPRKINYRVDMEYGLSEATKSGNRFMFYSNHLDHYTDEELEDLEILNLKECNFELVNEALWESGGRVFLFTPVTQGETTYKTFMKTNTPDCAEVVRISTYPGTDDDPATDVNTVFYKSTTFELANYNPFEFNLATEDGSQGSVALSYGPGQRVALSFDVKQTERTDDMGNTQLIDPFGTAFDVYIDAPMLTLDEEAQKNRAYLDAGKITVNADGRVVYHVAAQMDEENNYGTGGHKTLVFKTSKIVSAGDILVTAQEDIVGFTPGLLTLTNLPMTGTIVYREAEGGEETPVPAGGFVTFERADGTRIGTMTVTENGRFSVRLKPEYRYDWATVGITVHYRQMETGQSTVIYHGETTLPELVENNVRLVLTKEES